MRIGIFGCKEDDEVRLLSKRLKSKGVNVNVIDFNTEAIDAHISNEVYYKNENLFDYGCFYIRQLGYFLPVPDIQMSIGTWIDYYFSYPELLSEEIETLSLKHSIVEILDKEKVVVNPYESFKYHRLKPYQFYLFKKRGLKVPDFVVSGKDHDEHLIGKMIRKPLSGGEDVTDALEYLNKNPEVNKPLLMQDHIKGDVIRVFSTDEEFIGSAKQLNTKKHVDSRIDQDGVEVVSIPEEVKECTFKAMETLGMCFSGVDFIKSEDEYFLLECNPSPMFHNFEYLSGIRVSEKLAKYLIKKGKK